MKLKSKHSGFLFSCRPQFYYLPVLFLVCFFGANAQVKSVTEKPPVAKNMTEYKKTPQYTKRKSTLDKATTGPKTKDVKFQDGTVLHIKLDKNAPNDVMNGPVKKKVSSKKESSGGYDCTVTTVNLTSTSDSFLNNDYSGSTANIYPGACYTYASLTDGSWKEQTGARNAVTITTDNPNTKVPYVTVNNPSMATLYAAVAKLFSGFKNTNGNESLSYQVSDAENSATYNLQIGAAASGFGADLSNVYSTGNQSNHVHLTIDATKTLFTIMTTPPDSGFFKDPKIEATPYLSFIGEVSYGVRVLANADLTFTSEQEADQFKGSYSGFGVSVSLNVNYGSGSKSTNTTINGYMIGGPGSQVVAYSLDELKKQIEKAFAGATYQNARPIKYKAYSMAGDVLNTYSATDNFNERSCVPADGGSPEIDNIAVTFTQGNDGKEPNSWYTISVLPGINASSDFNNTMFLYQSPAPGNQLYANNGTITVILKPNRAEYAVKGKEHPYYKGKFDLATLQKEGGHIYLSPLSYQANSTGGVGTDIWKIDVVSVLINLKPTAANPNPKPMGGNSLTWNMQGPNELQLNSGNQTHRVFFFDRNFTPTGFQ
jgi:hypothetical protein